MAKLKTISEQLSRISEKLHHQLDQVKVSLDRLEAVVLTKADAVALFHGFELRLEALPVDQV